ncbi:MAG: tetratricopeptide repeat protein [Gammaproteobacteria bacterium]|nr:tetratricopeptide repeat protein [Gammaproteobacteria bacterium]
MSMSDKEQVQMVKGWWQEYGYYLLFTVVIFLAINFGWRYWHRHHNFTLEYSSAIYMQMLTTADQKKDEESKLFGESLIKDYPRSPYASFAALLLAKDAVEKGDLNTAFERLQFAMKKAPSKNIRQLARIRAARVLIAMKKSREALDLLNSVDDKDYAAETSEAFGDALLELGNTKEAELAYRKAQKLSEGKIPPSPLLKIKLQQF